MEQMTPPLTRSLTGDAKRMCAHIVRNHGMEIAAMRKTAMRAE